MGRILSPSGGIVTHFDRFLLPCIAQVEYQLGEENHILISTAMASWRAERGYVDDMGAAIALCVTSEQAAGRIYHVAEQRDLSEADWLRRIAVAAGWSGAMVPVPEEALPAHLREDYDATQDLALDSSRIRRELGYTELCTPEEAMHQTVAWERANPQTKFEASEFDYAAEDAVAAAPAATATHIGVPPAVR